ncbi:response regulator [Thalassoroseus pseudoceratinae]|uniref:response regulator n=1 Tax=Thalassoroseus pseudoceratinae TaxID=2713176 RepID=UPI001421AB68|nr:response regulator [Thalassoroseus pseudoceratinae]
MTSRRILVVDDDPDNCHNLFDVLTDFGHEVDIAHDGPAALKLVESKPYEIALLDFKMPGMDGLTLYREIRKLRAGTVAMIVTAYATPETQQEALEAGTWRVLAKPLDFGQLLAHVETALKQPLVLVVDDDHSLCENLWQLLRDRGYRVTLAHDCVDATRRLSEQTEYQVVLVDLQLPCGDGRDVLEEVRKSNPKAGTILITGNHFESVPKDQQVVLEEADAVCFKPFDVAYLLETIQRLAEVQEEL